MALLFNRSPLSDFLDGRTRELSAKVRSETDEYLLNVNEDDYVGHLVDTFTVAPIEIRWGDVYIEPTERNIPAREFPSGFNVYDGKSYPKQVVEYHLPFSGDASLLTLRPSTFPSSSVEAEVRSGELVLSVINWRDSAEDIKRAIDGDMRRLRAMEQRSTSEITKFNEELTATARSIVQHRKAEITTRDGVLAELGVPVRKAPGVPETFAVPKVKKRVLIERPAAPKAGRPEPTLDATTYGQILDVLADVGIEMERHPATHLGQDEEGLRDLLLMALAPNFESATGETFNKGGKTDILVRHEGSNVFVAEALIWRGPAYLLKKIDQALNNLTWRDSKVALVVFVRNKEIEPVLAKCEEAIPTHSCFVSRGSPRGPASLSYVLHLPGDETRKVEMAVLIFHLPEESK